MSAGNVLGRVATDNEIRQKLKEGWVFPLVLAKRWGIKQETVRMLAYQGKLRHIRNDRGLLVLDPQQPRSG